MLICQEIVILRHLTACLKQCIFTPDRQDQKTGAARMPLTRHCLSCLSDASDMKQWNHRIRNRMKNRPLMTGGPRYGR